jgi:hypothetical protein
VQVQENLGLPEKWESKKRKSMEIVILRGKVGALPKREECCQLHCTSIKEKVGLPEKVGVQEKILGIDGCSSHLRLTSSLWNKRLLPNTWDDLFFLPQTTSDLLQSLAKMVSGYYFNYILIGMFYFICYSVFFTSS